MAGQRKISVGLVQMFAAPKPQENLDRGLAKVEEAARKGAQVICLPELFKSQYFCQTEDPKMFDLAENVPGPTTDAFGALARKLGIV
ncbi:MAG TPA: nitrilase-related carbon-nitrogen hydrolase, partial [Bacteroidota bacterium]|nr:nitrilase-related carbon-nitrogen hydrolase [Bacteroidota bacterium]